MPKEKCPNCNGVGKVKCPRCKGIGQLPDNGSYKTCSMCSGTANATCPTCIGSGWITTPSRTSGSLIKCGRELVIVLRKNYGEIDCFDKLVVVSNGNGRGYYHKYCAEVLHII